VQVAEKTAQTKRDVEALTAKLLSTPLEEQARRGARAGYAQAHTGTRCTGTHRKMSCLCSVRPCSVSV
jgi:hypothetical protein